MIVRARGLSVWLVGLWSLVGAAGALAQEGSGAADPVSAADAVPASFGETGTETGTGSGTGIESGTGTGSETGAGTGTETTGTRTVTQDEMVAQPEPVRLPDPTPVTAVADSPTPVPVAASTAPAAQLSFELGRGFTVRAGDVFSANLQTRIQLRSTFALQDDTDPATNPTNETQVRTLRVWFRGNVIDPNVRYGIQLAFGANDFEAGNSSPVFDAYFELAHLRDLNVRVGQFFVPLDRARTIREFALQSVDRAQVVRELTLDRDVGVVLQSQDLFGEGGRFGYQLGVFAGDGRNRFGPHPLGFLYAFRAFARPLGTFDDDQEGDLTRQPTVRLMIGGGVAYNQSTDRPNSTTGTPYSFGSFDYLHAAGDLVLKFAGWYLLAEVVYRQATSARSLTRVNPTTMMDETIFSRDGWGLIAQTSYNFGPVLDLAQLELWARYEQLEAIGPTDPRLIATVTSRGRGLGAGVNLYFNNHALKVQLDWAHWFGDRVGPGEHQVRLQLDASF